MSTCFLTYLTVLQKIIYFHAFLLILLSCILFFPESCIIHIVKMSVCFLRYLTIWQEMIHFQFFLFQAIFWSIANQGLKKALSGSLPGRVNFPARQVSFHSHLPNGQGPREVICQLIEKKLYTSCEENQNLRAALDKLAFNVF